MPEDILPILPGDIFETIAQSLEQNPHFETVVASQGSFEQWVNWEAYVACQQSAAYDFCIPSPAYKDIGGPNRWRGDLRIAKGNTTVMIETKIIIDNTFYKYMKDISKDRDKLLTIKNASREIHCLQIILMSSARHNIPEDWKGRLKGISFWGKEEPSFKRRYIFRDCVSGVLYGWAI